MLNQSHKQLIAISYQPDFKYLKFWEFENVYKNQMRGLKKYILLNNVINK